MNVTTDTPTVASRRSTSSSKMRKAKSARSLLGGMSTMRTSLRKMGSFKNKDGAAIFNKSMSHMEFLSDSDGDEEDGQDSYSLWQEESAADCSGDDDDDDANDDVSRTNKGQAQDEEEIANVSEEIEERKKGKARGSSTSPPLSPGSPTGVNMESDNPAMGSVAPLITTNKALSPLPTVMPSRLSRRQTYKRSKSVGQLNALRTLSREDNNSISRRSSKSTDMDYKAMASLRVRRPSIEDRREKRNSLRKCKSLRGFGGEEASNPDKQFLSSAKTTSTTSSSASPPSIRRRVKPSRRDKYRRSNSASVLVSSSRNGLCGDGSLAEDEDSVGLSNQQKSPVQKNKVTTTASPSTSRRTKSASRRNQYRRSQSASNVVESSRSRLDYGCESTKCSSKRLSSPGKASPPIVRPKRKPLMKAVTFDERLRSANAKSIRRSSSGGAAVSKPPRRNSDDKSEKASGAAALRRIPRRKSDGFLDEMPEPTKKKSGSIKRIPPKSSSRRGRLMEPCCQPPAPHSFVLKTNPKKEALSLQQSLRNLGHIQVPNMLDQSGRSAGSGSISSLSMSSRMFADDSSISSSSKRSKFRRAYSSPKLLCKSTVLEEEDDDEEENNNTARQWSTSRWGTTSDNVPIQPSKDGVSVCGSQTGAPWKDSELSIPDTPSCSVQTGFVSELTTPSMASIHSTLLYGDEKSESRSQRPVVNRCQSMASLVSSEGSRYQTPSMTTRTRGTEETKDGAPKRPARRTSMN